MDAPRKNFDVDSLDPNSLVPVKLKLCEMRFLDSHLKTNLEFAIQAMEAFPAPRRHNACLMVEGNNFLLYLSAGFPVWLYTVYTGPNGPQLYQTVRPESQLTSSSLSDYHFAGHQCCDEIESCMEQAKKVLSDISKTHLHSLELKINCGELHLIYTTKKPCHTIYIQPHRRVYLGKTMSVEKILKTKTQLEKSGEMGKGLAACFQHLLVKSKDAWDVNSRIMLQGDGEMVEFITGKQTHHEMEYFIYTDAQNNILMCTNIKDGR